MSYSGPGTYVGGTGPVPCDVMVVGERPGIEEARSGVPFVGPSGEEQDRYLMMQGVQRNRIYITNLVKTFTGGNNPTDKEIAEHESELIRELGRVRPRFVLSVGAHSTRWFLGDVDMETVHGLPQRSEREGLKGIVIVPCYHPAYGLRDPEAKSLVYYDYQQAGLIINGKISSQPVEDSFPRPHYIDGGVQEIREVLRDGPEEIAEDTEGHRGSEWGFSLSKEPGVGYVFRRAHPEFLAVARIYHSYRQSASVLSILHNSMWDIEIERNLGMGAPVRIYDTMVAAFFLRLEPQALKTLARRHCGMEMREYEEVIGEAAFEKQLTYILEVGAETWGKPAQQLIVENDGQQRVYTPQGLNQRIERILADYGTDSTTDFDKRWKAIDKEVRRAAEERFGPLPQATLNDIPLEEAIRYSGRDPDATLRVYQKLRPKIREMGLADRLQLDLDIIPIFEEMQSTGIPASRSYFEKLRDEMTEKMDVIRGRIEDRHGIEHFNPMSQPQVSKLVTSMGLKGAKKTKKGGISTSKKSMEHLRSQNDTMSDIFDWREHEKVRDSFAEPILEYIPAGVEYHPVRCTIKITRVAQDRISASDPNLTAMPVASDLGRRVRDGFLIPDGDPTVFLTGDMSQIEMRVMADLSKDKVMCQLFRDGRDIHKETAAKIFSLPLDKIDKMLHRNPTKRAGFGVITGIQGQGLYDQLRMMGVNIDDFCRTMGIQPDKYSGKYTSAKAVAACNALIEEWFKVYPGCRGFLKNCGGRAYKDGFVRERGGFIRYLPGVWSKDEYVSAEARRQSHSHIISGTAQSMLREAMRWMKPQVESLRRELDLPINWLMQIHDEVLFRVHEDIAPVVQDMLYEALTQHAGGLSIPIEASTAIAKSWGSLEK